MKKILGFICAVLLIVATSYYLLQEPWFFKVLLKTASQTFIKEFVLTEISFQDHKIEFFKSLQFNNLKLTIVDKKNNQWTFFARELNVRSDDILASGEKHFDINIKSFNFDDHKNLVLSEGDLTLDFDLWHKRITDVKGDLNIGSIVQHPIEIKNFKTYIQGYNEEIHFQDFWGQLLGGVIKGEITLEYSKYLPYSIDVQFVGVDTAKIKGALAKNMKIKGIFDGNLGWQGDQKSIFAMSGKFNSAGNVYVHTSLFSLLVNYLPQQKYFRLFKEISKKEQYVPVEEFEVVFENKSDSVLFAQTHFVSRDYNLNANLGFDVNLNAPLVSIFSLWKGIGH